MDNHQPCSRKGCNVLTPRLVEVPETRQRVPLCRACEENFYLFWVDGQIRFVDKSQMSLAARTGSPFETIAIRHLPMG